MSRLKEYIAKRKAHRLAARIKQDWAEVEKALIKTGWSRAKRRQFRRDLIHGTAINADQVIK